jgi:hypothetical protein
MKEEESSELQRSQLKRTSDTCPKPMLSHMQRHALEMATLAFKPYTYKPTAPRAQQPTADLPRNRSTSSTSSSTSRRVVHHLAPYGQQLMTEATSLEFEVCERCVGL